MKAPFRDEDDAKTWRLNYDKGFLGRQHDKKMAGYSSVRFTSLMTNKDNSNIDYMNCSNNMNACKETVL